MPSLLVPGPAPAQSAAPPGRSGGMGEMPGSAPHAAVFALLLAQTQGMPTAPTTSATATASPTTGEQKKDDPLTTTDPSALVTAIPITLLAATLPPPTQLSIKTGPPTPPTAEKAVGKTEVMDASRPTLGGELLSPTSQTTKTTLDTGLAKGLPATAKAGPDTPRPLHSLAIPADLAPSAKVAVLAPNPIQTQTALEKLPGIADTFTRKTVAGKDDAKASDGAASSLISTLPSGATETAPTDKPQTAMPAQYRAQMMQQVADKVGALHLQAARTEQKQVLIELHPRDWGTLHVSITMAPASAAGQAESNTVVAHILADNPAVKAALENHTSELRHALREIGLKLDSLTVQIQSALPSGQAGTATSDNRHSQDGAGAWAQPAPSQNAGAQGSATGQGQGQPAFTFGDGGQPSGGRQGQASQAWAGAQAERADAPPTEQPNRADQGRVDTLA